MVPLLVYLVAAANVAANLVIVALPMLTAVPDANRVMVYAVNMVSSL